MGNINFDELINLIYSAVITVPGVAGFAPENCESYELDNELLTDNFSQAIKITKDTKDTIVVNLSLVLLEGTNVRDIAQEAQIRVKYELEKLKDFSNDFIVNILIRNLISK